jgi:hypothetical protein
LNVAEDAVVETPSFASAVKAAKSAIAEANAVTDANLEDQAVPEVAPVGDQSQADVLEHPQSFADKAQTSDDSPFLFEDVAETLVKPNPFEGVGEDKPLIEQFVSDDRLEAPIQVDELVNGYLRQADYTRKTQQLAEERKAFQAESELASKLIQALRDDPAGTVASMAVEMKLIAESDLRPDLVNKINREYRVPSREEVEREISERAKALVDSDPRVQDAEDMKLRAQVEATFSELEAEHGVKLSDRDKDLVLQQAVEMQTMRLDLAYLALKQKADKLRAERQAAKQSAPQVAGVGGAPAPKTDADLAPVKDIREAWARTMKSAQ